MTTTLQLQEGSLCLDESWRMMQSNCLCQFDWLTPLSNAEMQSYKQFKWNDANAKISSSGTRKCRTRLRHCTFKCLEKALELRRWNNYIICIDKTFTTGLSLSHCLTAYWTAIPLQLGGKVCSPTSRRSPSSPSRPPSASAPACTFPQLPPQSCGDDYHSNILL